MKLLLIFLFVAAVEVYGTTYHADEVWYLKNNWDVFQDGDLIILDTERVYILLPFNKLSLTFSGVGDIFFVDDIPFDNLVVQGSLMNLREHVVNATSYTQVGGVLANGTVVVETLLDLDSVSYENLVLEGPSVHLENVSCRLNSDSSQITPDHLQANHSCVQRLEDVLSGEISHSQGQRWVLEEPLIVLQCNVTELEAGFIPDEGNSVTRFFWALNETLLINFNTTHLKEISAYQMDFHGGDLPILGNDFLLNHTQFFGPGNFELNRLQAGELRVNCSGETAVTVELLETPLIHLDCTFEDGYVLGYRESTFNITNPELEIVHEGEYFFLLVRPTNPLPVYPSPHSKIIPTSPSAVAEDFGPVIGVTVGAVLMIAGVTALTIFLVKRNAKKHIPAYQPLIHK